MAGAKCKLSQLQIGEEIWRGGAWRCSKSTRRMEIGVRWASDHVIICVRIGVRTCRSRASSRRLESNHDHLDHECGLINQYARFNIIVRMSLALGVK